MMKGSILDLVFMIIICFVLSVSFILSYYVTEQFHSTLNQTIYDQGLEKSGGYNESLEIMGEGEQALLKFGDAFIVIIIAIGIAIVIGASMIRTHPIFFVASLFMLVIFIFIGAQFSNFFNAIIITSEFASVANEFPLMVKIMRNMPIFVLIFGAITAIVMYGKIKTGGEASV